MSSSSSRSGKSLDGNERQLAEERNRRSPSTSSAASSTSFASSTAGAAVRYRLGVSPSSSPSAGGRDANGGAGRSRFRHSVLTPRAPPRRRARRRSWFVAWLRGSDEMPGVLPYVLCILAGVAGIMLPFAELMAQGIPKLAKDFRAMALHLPTRSVAKRPMEGLHFQAGELHGESRTLGNATALKYVMEFTDFFCNHCQEAHHTTMLPLISSKSLRDGRLRIESHPLAYLGEESVRAAHAALCAQEQHKYWEMRDLLFQVSLEEKVQRAQIEGDEQRKGGAKPTRSPMTFDSLLLKRLASLSGLDAISFAKCLHSERHVSEVKRLNSLAHNLGVHGTPYFVFDRSSGRRNKFQDLHTHREGVVPQDEVRRLLRLDD